MTQPAAAGSAGLAATLDVLAAELVALYAGAETRLLDQVAQAAAAGLTDPSAGAQLVMLAEMRRAAQRVATALKLRSAPLAQQIATEAAQHGDTAAYRILRSLVAGDPRLTSLYLGRTAGLTGHGIAAAAAIGLDLAARLDSTRLGIIRFADDAYRAAVADAATRLVLNRDGLTPATAQQHAWTALTRQGVTGFVDTAGRNWNLSSYVEMATRTAVQRAYNTAHEDRMTAVGIHYFTISHDGRPCPLCKPWEGAVLSDRGAGVSIEPDARTGRPVAFNVTGTLDEARAAGLQHPNCKHVLLPYLPGVTKASASKAWTAADERQYRATQQLRALERQVRAAKRQLAAALDEQSRRRAAAAVRAAQARIRAHVAAHDLVRRTRREQLDLGNR